MNISTTAGRERTAAYRVLRRIFDEGFATGNDAIADEVCSPDLVDHQFGTAGRGAEAIAARQGGHQERARGSSRHHGSASRTGSRTVR